MEEVKGTKLIGIGNDGIQKLEEVESKVVEKIDIEKISINKDVEELPIIARGIVTAKTQTIASANPAT